MKGPRERLIGSAIALVRERGVDATGMSELLQRSKAARGSVYQHFPGGKFELIEASTRSAGALVSRAIARQGQVGAAVLVRGVVDRIARELVADDYALGCPVAAAAMAPPEAIGVRRAAAEVFDSWVVGLAAILVEEGRSADEAQALAGVVVSAVEGAIMRARTSRSTAPLSEVAAFLGPVLDAG